jgi:radical SAM superfamily enzyme YgiQ (UPF0313 family)
MHTATRLAAPVIRQVRELNPAAHLCAYGLYAPVNHVYLHTLGVETVIGGEFEQPLTALATGLDERVGPSRSPPYEPTVSLARQQFRTPDRSGLPPLDKYAHLQLADGSHHTVGYTEATRGCKHLCRHCPIVPVYGGRFRVVQRDVVLEDIDHQVRAGAEHITFGDPDFFNGPGHAIAIVRALHERFPALTYDVTIKVEHLLRYRQHLQALRDTGCLFVTCAVESFDDRILDRFDKQHTRQDFLDVLAACRRLGLALNPTFVAFTPWAGNEDYLQFLATIGELGLVANVAPVQYGIRLLIPEGSRLLELQEVQDIVGRFDENALCYPWTHPDQHVDELQRAVVELVQQRLTQGASREQIFNSVCALALHHAGASSRLVQFLELHHGPPRERVPYLTEPWYC